MSRIIHCIFLFSILFLFVSCKGIHQLNGDLHRASSNCNQQGNQSYTIDELPKPLHELTISQELRSHFSERSLHIAQAINLIPMLEYFLEVNKNLHEDNSLENRLEMLEISLQLSQRINISSLEISASASEMDCEEERADQIASYLKNKQDREETKYTVGAIIVGATAAIIAGVLLARGNTGNLPEFVGIGAGLIEATFGVLILKDNRKVDIYHNRNPLKDIWEGPETSEIFPASVWYYFSYEEPGSETKSVRKQLVDNWIGFGQIADVKKRKKEQTYKLYFGNGGRYTAYQLFNRANMHDQIEAQINIMKQNLMQLATEIENIRYQFIKQ